jgi:hypothetical protein
MSFTTLITPSGKYEYIANGDQTRITFWALRGNKREWSRSTSVPTELARRDYESRKQRAIFA